jgi:hypothetical protein
MSDTAGWYAIIGAAIGAVGVQLTGIIQAVSESRARRAAAAAEAKAAKEIKRRPMYEKLINDLDNATEGIHGKLGSLADPGRSPPGYVKGLRDLLAPVRSGAVSMQIDGSDRARTVATSVLDGTADMWQEIVERQPEGNFTPFTKPALTKAYDAMVKARADMIDVSREDIGG